MGFKKDFVWGAATASYQIEGAAYEDGKGLNIWDTFCREDGKIFKGQNGDVACDHYHRVEEDVKLMSEMGLKAYRFSVSWARLMPTGRGEICKAGIDFYNKLIDTLIKYGITPYMTLYHWDLPYELHCRGGWLNDDITEDFAAYARVIAENFSDRVKHFMTFNEPQVFVGCGYKQGAHAPGYTLCDAEILRIGQNVLKAHGKAVKALREYSKQPVEIGIVAATSPQVPSSEKPEDVEAARSAYFTCGASYAPFSMTYWYDTIIFGRYPKDLLETASDIMPAFTEDDMKLISQPIDFIGLNIYMGDRHLPASQGGGVKKSADGFPRTSIGWEITPETLYWGPKFFFERYGKPIYIAENGMAAHDVISLDGKVHDPNRIDYMNRYLLQFRRAAEDGAELEGYFAWSLMDNFEWAHGYNERFGMIYVDYETQKRTFKDSAYWYKSIIESNGETL